MKRAAVALVALVLAAAAWLAWSARHDVATGAVETVAARRSDGAPEMIGGAVGPDVAESSRTDRASARETVRVEPPLVPTSATLTLRGRVVDEENGAPLAGCSVALRAYPSVFMTEEQREQTGWANPFPHTTADDGVFSFTITPPPNHWFELAFEDSNHLPRRAGWSRLDPGVRDLGDIAMSAGCMVRGVVRDQQGVPQGDLGVSMDGRRDKTEEGFDPLQPQSGLTARDGSFAMRVPPGRWWLYAYPGRILAPAHVTIEKGQADLSIAVTVEPVVSAAICGVLVDDAGAPVRDAFVTAVGTRASVESDGTFCLRRSQHIEDDAVQLTFETERGTHERFTTPEKYRWDTSGHRFVMQPRLTCEIIVVDAESGTPIEDYAVRCFAAQPNQSGYVTHETEPRAAGHHPEGRLRLPCIARGPNLLMVEPTDERWDRTSMIAFDSADIGSAPMRIPLSRLVTVTMRVQMRAGAPVAGAAIELGRPVPYVPNDLSPHAMWVPDQETGKMRFALTIATGTTDASGACAVRGPMGSPLLVRVRGPGHPPHVEDGLVLTEGGEIVITVERGATLVGRIGPACFLDGLRRLAHPSSKPMGLVLGKSEGWSRYPQFYGERLPLDDSGAFSCTGLPPGTWEVLVEFEFNSDPGTLAGASQPCSERLQTVVLREGETTEVHADLAVRCPGRVRGRVLLDGAVPEEGWAVLWEWPSERSMHTAFVVSARFDEEGQFALEASPGTYRVVLHVPRTWSDWLDVPAPEIVTVTAGGEVTQEFHARTAATRVRVLGSDGKPRSGVAVDLRLDGNYWPGAHRRTDAEGWAAFDPVPALQLDVTVKPRGGHGAANEPNVVIGRVDVRPGAKTEVELTLPESAGY